jgi:hypothetical protein
MHVVAFRHGWLHRYPIDRSQQPARRGALVSTATPELSLEPEGVPNSNADAARGLRDTFQGVSNIL